MPDTTPTPSTTAEATIKAGVVRGFVVGLREDGLFDQVAAAVSPATRHVMDTLPPASTWLPSGVLDDLVGAVASVRDDAYLKRLSRRASDQYVGFARPIIQGTLRLFGTSPATLLSRMGLFSQANSRGTQQVFEYLARGDRAGTLTVIAPSSRPMSHATAVVLQAGVEHILELCSARDGVASPVRTEPRGGHIAYVYDVRW